MTAATACSRLRSLLRLALLGCASLVAAEVQAATPPATWTTGHKKVLIIPVRFTDQTGPSEVPNAQGYRSGWGEMTNGTTAAALNAFFQRSSYGKLSMEFTVLPEINLGVSYTNYNATYGTSGLSKFAAWEEPGSFADDVRAKAQQVGIAAGQAALYDSDNYDLDFLFCGFIPGQGTLASGRAHGKGVFGTTSLALAHEFGHNFGLAHANGISRSTFHSQLKSGTFFTDPYGDVFDLMGWKNTAPVPLVPDRDVNPFWKWQMGWLPDANIATPAVSGTYRIHAFDQPALEAGKNYALRVVRDPSRVYWFSYRASITNEESLWSNNGLEVRIGGESVPATGGHTTLFDMTPGSRGLANIPSVTNNPYATLYDAPLAIGRTYSDNEANLHVTPVKKAGTAPESLDVVLNYGPFPGNSAPTASISPATLTLAAGVAQTFTATASDANGDTLAYYWEFDDPDALGGTAAGNTNPDARLSTQGSHTWTRSGTFLARCTVSDMKGGKTIASATVTITGGTTALRTITGVVKDENGNPLAGAVVNNYKGGNPNFVRYGATNFVGASETAADGKYVVHVPVGITGTLYLNVLHQGFSFTSSAAGGAVGVYSASVANVDFNRVRTNRTVSGGVYVAGRGYNPATDGTLTVNVNGQSIAATGGGWSTTVADGTPLNITPTAGTAGNSVFGMFPNPYVAVDDFNLLHLFLNVAGQMPQVGFTSSGATSDDTVGTVNIPVTLALPPGSNSWPANQFLVYWLDPSGTAEYGVDFKMAGGSINFTGGQVPTPYLIPLKILPTGEPKNKTVVIKLGPASSIVNMGPTTTFTYTITNAPAPPPNAGVIQFAQASYSVAESAGTVTLVATRTGSSSGSASGYYRTANGTASAGQDYTPTTNFVTWLDGDTANKNVVLTILNDAVVESAETFTVTFFTNTVGATLGAQTVATVTITDDDVPISTNPPQITAQPVGVTTTVGNNVNFAVTATGTPTLGFQWRLNGSPIPSATSPTLALNNVQTNQAGGYSVVITNSFGSVTSSVVALVVNPAPPAGGTIYEVGPGRARTLLRDVPWATLQPGDIVNIHSKPGGYKEKIQISASGTANARIVIRGIPDPVTGALPIIDGKDAVEDPSIDFRSPVFSDLGIIVVSPRKTGYVYGVYHVSFVDLETLDIRNALYTADNSITYTDQTGAVRGYHTFGCGIYIEWAHDLTIRGCEISYCGNGLFANSKNLAAQSSARLLIERNYFHDNSHPYIADPNNPGSPLDGSNGYHHHHCYTESVGAIYQYNRFGRLRPGAHGVAIKDRSSGQIIRYNEFDMTEQSNVLNLADAQGGSGHIDVQPDYRDSYVYGNLITIQPYASSISMVFWGAFNGPNFYAAQHRGTLHFYHNTIVNHHESVALFLMPDRTYTGTNRTYETVDCRNNIFFTDTTLQNNIYDAMYFTTGGSNSLGGGDVVLGKNWISPNWRKESPNHPSTSQLLGTANLIVGDVNGANNPGFADMANRDYRLLTGANSLDAAGPLAPAVLPANDVSRQYAAPQTFVARVTLGAALDLGAVESTGAAPPPGPGQLQFASANYSVNEAAGSVTLTVLRVNGTNGAVGVSYTTANGTAVAPGDYLATASTLAWAAGDATPKVISVPIANDALVESSESFSVSLSNPTGTATLGSPTTATVTLFDDDAPPVSTVPNRRPQSQPQCLLVVLNTATPITLAGRDGDGDPLTYSITVAPTRGVLSGTAPNLTYTPNNNVSGPDYFCFVANDGKTDSHPAVVTLAINSSANPPPVVSLLTPATNSWFVGPTNIVLTASATDADGIYAVEFYEGTNALAQLFTPPFTFTWTNPPPGTYTLLAKAYDAGGRRGLSAPATIRVLGAMPVVNVRPTGGMFQVAWPLGVSGAVLEESTNLRQWSLVTNAVVDTATERTHSFTPGPGRYFRFSVW